MTHLLRFAMANKLRILIAAALMIFVLYSITLMTPEKFHAISAINLLNSQSYSRKISEKSANHNQSTSEDEISEVQNSSVKIFKDTDNFFVWQPKSALDTELDQYLIYPHEYEPFVDNFTITPKFCRPEQFPLLILITSAPKNFDRRRALRDTWLQNIGQYNMKYWFLIGGIDEPKIMTQIAEEDKQFNDVIQWNFRDSYMNLTLKVLLAFKWQQMHCNSTRFVMKTDDDMFVDSDLMFNDFIRPLQRVPLEKRLYGFLYRKAPVVRRKKTIRPWYVPMEIYSRKLYPDFASGVLYVLTNSAVSAVVSAAESLLPALYLEDVFLTGFAGQYGNVTKVDFKRNSMIFAGKCKVDEVRNGKNAAVIGHYCKPDDLRAIYKLKQNLIVNVV